MKTFKSMLVLLVCLVLVNGCLPSPESDPPPPPQDTTKPRIISKLPLNGVIETKLNTEIKADFSEKVLFDSFTIVDEDGQIVPGTFTGYKTATVSFVPYYGTLPLGKTLTATISNVRDGSDNNIGNVSWSFTTEGVSVPRDAEANVSRDTEISISFSEKVTYDTIEVKDENDVALVGSTATSADEKTIIFTPDAPLSYNKEYIVNLTGVNYGSGGNLGDISWSFTTEQDITAPTVSQYTPPQGSADVDITTEVKAVFSEAVVFDDFQLVDGNGNVVAGETTGNGSNTLSFIPDRHLEYTNSYDVTIAGVEDLSGNKISAGSANWSFTVENLKFNYHATPSAHNNDDGSFNSIAFSDDSGTVLAYYDAINESLEITATDDGGSTFLDDPKIIDTNIAADNIRLLVDTTGRYHVLYQHKIDGLKYATAAAGPVESTSWDTVPVDAAGSFGAMALDSNGDVHISYYDAAATALKYATKSLSDAAFSTEVVDPGEESDDPGKFSSIKVGTDDRIHTSYFDYHAANTNGNLKYAVRDTSSGKWSTDAIDTTGDVGRYSSLTLHDDKMYISYYDTNNNSINLINNEAGMWKSETFVTGIDSAGAAPIIIDSEGFIHMSYYSNDGLCYAFKGMTTLIDQPVDISGIGNGVESSLALDNNGKIHIAYYDATDKDLKYAHQQ
jgi:hypothetical protein